MVEPRANVVSVPNKIMSRTIAATAWVNVNVYPGNSVRLYIIGDLTPDQVKNVKTTIQEANSAEWAWMACIGMTLAA